MGERREKHGESRGGEEEEMVEEKEHRKERGNAEG